MLDLLVAFEPTLLQRVDALGCDGASQIDDQFLGIRDLFVEQLSVQEESELTAVENRQAGLRDLVRAKLCWLKLHGEQVVQCDAVVDIVPVLHIELVETSAHMNNSASEALVCFALITKLLLCFSGQDHSHHAFRGLERDWYTRFGRRADADHVGQVADLGQLAWSRVHTNARKAVGLLLERVKVSGVVFDVEAQSCWVPVQFCWNAVFACLDDTDAACAWRKQRRLVVRSRPNCGSAARFGNALRPSEVQVILELFFWLRDFNVLELLEGHLPWHHLGELGEV